MNIKDFKFDKLLTGFYGSSLAYYIAQSKQTSPSLIITASSERAEELVAELKAFSVAAELYPSWDTLYFELVSPSIQISALRLWNLLNLHKTKNLCLVASLPAILQKTLPLDYINLTLETFTEGSQLDYSNFTRKILALGYKKVSLVQNVADFALRGNVIDIFCSQYSKPVRIELEDATIKSLRLFNCDDQLTIETINSFTICAVREQLDFTGCIDCKNTDNLLKRLKHTARKAELPEKYNQALLLSLQDGEQLPAQELLSAIAGDNFLSLLEQLPNNTKLFIEQIDRLSANASQQFELINSRHSRMPKLETLAPEVEQIFLSQAKFEKLLSEQNLFASTSVQLPSVKMLGFKKTDSWLSFKSEKARTLDLEKFLDSIIEKLAEDYRIFIFTENTARLEDLFVALNSKLIKYHQVETFNQALKIDTSVTFIRHSLTEGFYDLENKLWIVGETEIFGYIHRKKLNTSKNYLKKLMNTISNLDDGDYIVHQDYGIGYYRGLKNFEVEGIPSDFIQIDYADSKLFLPVQNINKIQKYSASEEALPTIDKLSSGNWSKVKQKVRKQVEQLAAFLVDLYARRNSAEALEFGEINELDRNFANEFPFTETEDQALAISDTLADMSRNRIMDRLVCGDVGFGKTEVALRAAFKAFQSGKQVAVLSPTTILCDQHFETFQNRFVNFSARIKAISRFYSNSENKETLADLEAGKIDIIIGTHALLQPKVRFYDLGLIIVDEEHRFGVKHKEILKNLKSSAASLTLTATPIPRTLHMSLLGIRDISLIATAPQQRQSVKTYIASFDLALIADAIQRELERGGQIYFLHNRVMGIETLAKEISEVVPNAKIAIAHGQMSANKLEKIMHDFIQKKFDILLCTTIIESGLDIPNANTIIINRADSLGLAQLYQLRGRVGRSTKQAYAYLLVPRIDRLSAKAHERLKALQEIDDLGKGFQLALRDLEIRGAGNLLGREQSGNVAAVGYDLYMKILQQATLELKNNKGGENFDYEEIEPEVKVKSPAYIPVEFIPDISERLIIYQRLSNINDSNEMSEFRNELEDRFGSIPDELDNLLRLVLFKNLLRVYKVLLCQINDEQTRLNFASNAPVNSKQLLNIKNNNPNLFRIVRNDALLLNHKLDSSNLDRSYREILSFLALICKNEE